MCYILTLQKPLIKLDHDLRDLGRGGKRGEWLHDFLKDRRRAVITIGVHLKGISISSGVPDGTVLEILLFIDMASAAQIVSGRLATRNNYISWLITTPQYNKKFIVHVG